MRKRTKVVGDPEMVARIFSYERKISWGMSFLLVVILYTAGPSVVQYAAKGYDLPEIISWTIIVFASIYLSLSIQHESSLQHFDAIIYPKGKGNTLTLVNKISQPNEFRSRCFFQRLSDFLILFFAVPATIFTSIEIILSNLPAPLKYCGVPLIFIFFFLWPQ